MECVWGWGIRRIWRGSWENVFSVSSVLTVLDQIVAIVAGLLFLAVGWGLGIRVELRRQQAAKMSADDIRAEAEKNASELLAKSKADAEAEAGRITREAEQKMKEAEASLAAEKTAMEAERESDAARRSSLEALSRKIAEREDIVDSKEKKLGERESLVSGQQSRLDVKEERLFSLETELREKESSLAESEQKLQEGLERQAGLSKEQALEQLLERVENANRLTLSRRISRAEAAAKEEAERRARRIVTLAIQKVASEQVMESALSVVSLPSDDMKGRIIGREGRNIHMLRNLTGVDFIIDDTPAAVLLSSFDPVRREIASRALEALVADGRIQPAKIEEVVNNAKREVADFIVSEGDRAALEAGVSGLAPELVKYLGRLRFRTSYDQNVLTHSLEVSFLAACMAAEVGADIQTAARAGLLHDIGKAVSADVVGPHAVIGGRICEKFGENEAVVHCVEAHHEDVEQRTLEAMLVQAADAISAARPGARRDNVENYVKRLEDLEKIASDFEGVEQVYAIHAGREVRVCVNPRTIDDLGAADLARKIADRIEKESQYPGEVLVTVVRENRQQAKAQ